MRDHQCTPTYTREPDNLSHSIKELLITLLPVLIELVLATDSTTKIECLQELCSSLKLDNIMTEYLESTDINNVSISQHSK